MDITSNILGAPDNSENEDIDDELGNEEDEQEDEESSNFWIIRTLLDEILNYVCHVHDDDEEECYETSYSCSSCSEITSSDESIFSAECMDARMINCKLWLRRHEAQIQRIIKKTRRPICDVLMANLDEVYRIFMVKQILNDAEREKNWDVLFWKTPEQLKFIPRVPEVFEPFKTIETCNRPVELVDLPAFDICEHRLRKHSWLMSKYLEEKLRKLNIILPNFQNLEVLGTNIKQAEPENSTLDSYFMSTEGFYEEEEDLLYFDEEIDCITFQLGANERILCGRYNNIEINLAYETFVSDRHVQTVKFQNIGRIAIRFNFLEIYPPQKVFYYNRNTFKLIPEQIRDFDVFFQPTAYGLYTEHIHIEMNSGNSVTINLFGYCSIGLTEMRSKFEHLENEMQHEISRTIVKNQLEQIIKKSDPTEYYEKNYEIILTPEILWTLKNPHLKYDLEKVDNFIIIFNEITEVPSNFLNSIKWNYDLKELYTAILALEDDDKRADLYHRFCLNYDSMRSIKHVPITRNEEKIYKVRALLVSLLDTFEKIAIDLRQSSKQPQFNDDGGAVEHDEEVHLERNISQNFENDENELNKNKYDIYIKSLQLKTFHLLYTAIDDIVNAIESTNIRN